MDFAPQRILKILEILLCQALLGLCLVVAASLPMSKLVSANPLGKINEFLYVYVRIYLGLSFYLYLVSCE